MSEERRYYQSIRRKADRARERLAATLEQSRTATARDERTDERRAARDSVDAGSGGGERTVTRFGKRARTSGKNRQVGAKPEPVQSRDAERE